MFCLCSLKRKKSFNVFTVVLIFPQAINVLSSQDVGPSVKSWPDSCYVPHWWGPWLSIDDANFGQKWWHQKWKKGQGSSRPVTGGTGVSWLLVKSISTNLKSLSNNFQILILIYFQYQSINCHWFYLAIIEWGWEG